MIQGVISRMSGFSASAKNFAVTVLVALVALAFDKGASLFWTGVGALVTFLAMDFYYHLLEVRFRELYRSTANSPLDLPSNMLLDAPKATGAHMKKVFRSLTLLPFYVLLLFAFAIALYEAAHVSAPGVEFQPVAARGVGRSSPQNPAVRERPRGSIGTPATKQAKRLSGPAKHPAEAGEH
jgi:hypothetical protein